LFIYFVLIGLGGRGADRRSPSGSSRASARTPSGSWQQWLLPCGAVGAVLVAAWLVEAKQSVIENMAPVLGRLFTPLFTASCL
jgi:hypothetical protein